MDASAATGRWEKKKRATRDAMLAAAAELFRAKGFAATTVQEITDAADVSERTFFRYFESKEDLLLPDLVALFASVEHELARRAPDEPPLGALREAVCASLAGRPGRSLVRSARDLDPASTPSPVRLVRVFIEWEERLTTVLTDRLVVTGADRDSGDVRLRAAVTARAAVAALRAGVRAFRGAPARERRSAAALTRYVADAFAILEAGSAPPRRPGPAARGPQGAPRRRSR